MKKVEMFQKYISDDYSLAVAADQVSKVTERLFGLDLGEIIQKLEDKEQQHICRITYKAAEESASGREQFVFELRGPHDDEFEFSSSYDLVNDMVYYQALTKIRELIREGYEIRFA